MAIIARAVETQALTTATIPVTPELAERWLSQARPNRKLVLNLVRTYARMMATGAWELNGEAIILNEHGMLMNGQHRLRAVIESGVTVMMLVVSGVQDSTFDTVDTGRHRVGRDVLSVYGYVDPISLAAAASWLWKYELSEGVLTSVIGRSAPTNTELLEILAQHPELPDSLHYGSQLQRMMGRGLAGFLHYIMSRRDRAAADRFFTDLATGENLQHTRAVYLIRETLIANRQSKRKLVPLYVIGLMIRAFNYERMGRVTHNVRWRQKGPTKEAFPTLN